MAAANPRTRGSEGGDAVNLNERPTPLTEALRIKIITDPTMDGGDRLVAVLNHARTLERSLAERTEERDTALAKLAKCREALKAVVENPPCSDPDCCEAAISCEGARKLAIITLEETK